MVPSNSLVDTDAYCLADSGREYVVYSKIGASTRFNLNLSAAAGVTLSCRFYNPLDGQFEPTFWQTGGCTQSFTQPDSDDWVLHVAVESPGDFDHDGDADMVDLGLFMLCVSGPSISVDVGCEDREYDTDSDVDQDDFCVFQWCISGEDIPSFPGCSNWPRRSTDSVLINGGRTGNRASPEGPTA